MCGRMCLSLNKDQVRCACSYKPRNSNIYTKPEWLLEHNAGKDFTPSYNIAPTEVTPVLVSASKYRNETHCDRLIKPMMWGMIPPWHKAHYKTHKLSTNNCRLENIKTSKLYNSALRTGGRCIIVVEGFYEWQTTDKAAKIKQPYYIYAPQDNNIEIDDPNTWDSSFDEKAGWRGIFLLHMAGLYNVWQHDNDIIYSYAIITMESNETLSWLHHRVPAVLSTQEQIEAWLDIDNVDPDMALAYLKPVNLLSWHKVDTTVNNSRNKTYVCNKRLKAEDKKERKQKTLKMWFKKIEKRKISIDESTSNSKEKKMKC